MPREGYSSITVSTQLYKKLQKLAGQVELTVPKYIESILEDSLIEVALEEAPTIG